VDSLAARGPHPGAIEASAANHPLRTRSAIQLGADPPLDRREGAAMKFEELTELEQKVLKLRLEGKKHREIAAELGFSATRAYELTTRARRRLRGPNLSIRLLHCLRRLTPERTQLMTDDELLAISGIGPEALEELRSRYPYLGGLPCPHCGGTGRLKEVA